MGAGFCKRAALVQRYEKLGYWKRKALGDLLKDTVATHADTVALVDGATRLTYVELDQKADWLASGLSRLGINRGDRVLLQLPNGEAFVLSLFALLRIGALPIMAMPAHREKDVLALCQLAEPSAYIVARSFLGFDYLELAQRVRQSNPSVRHVLVDGDPGPWEDLSLIGDAPRDFQPPEHTDTALLLLSGGTTGTPKLIPRTHTDYLYNAIESARLCGFSSDTTYLAALPVSHNFPLACPGILGTFSVGGRVVMSKVASTDETFPLIADERVTHTALVPPLVKLWLDARQWDDSDLSTLKLLQVGGARLDSELAKQISPGCQLQQVFGMAEGLLCYTRLDDPPDVIVNTQGRPLCLDDEVRIVDPNGCPVTPGQIGELQVRGPYTIGGYYRAPDHNASSFTSDGFYRSGDLVQLTEQGNIVVHGRAKEQINRAGEKIATAEIEDVLVKHPNIDACTVIAVPDDRLGERTCAAIIVTEQAPSLSDIQAFLRDAGLPRYKLPDQLLEVAAWPLTTVGKIDKQRLVSLSLKASSAAPDASRESKISYVESRISVKRQLIDILTTLVSSWHESEYVLYEQPDEWSAGLGRVATLRASADQVELTQNSRQQIFRLPRLVDSINAATEKIEVAGWRAYGAANFELAQVFHGLPNLDSEACLLELFVPKCEVRIRSGQATLRAIDPIELKKLQSLIEEIDQQAETEPALPTDEKMLLALRRHDEDAYKENIRRAVEEINAGEYHKVILSRRVPLPENVDLVETWRNARKANTPARSFLVRIGDALMAGLSPETVVEVNSDGWVSSQPLAGTRALGANREEEERLREGLLNDAKEVAEHAMSVKLAQEEIAKVCDSPKISEFMQVLRRGSVQHLASRIGGHLRTGQNAWHAFEALFPAVTASGIPKKSSIAAIQRFEHTRRDWYSGCVLVVDHRGGIDAALVLRTIYQRNDEIWLQAGAGIIGQSTPTRELEETNEKLACLLKHIVFMASTANESITITGGI